MEQYKELMKERLSENRYNHSLGVAKTAAKLAIISGINVDKAYLAGLLHDYGKELKPSVLLQIAQEKGLLRYEVDILNPDLLHGPVGACLLRDEKIINDEEVLKAIAHHTTGHPDMGILEKIIYVADYIEPSRNFPGVELMRKIAFEHLDFGCLSALDNTIQFVLQKGSFLHPLSVDTRNRLIEQVNLRHCN